MAHHPATGSAVVLVVLTAVLGAGPAAGTTEPGPQEARGIQRWSNADRQEAVRAAVADLLDITDLAMASRDYPAAISALTRLQRGLPRASGIANNLGVVHAAAGHPKEALEWFRKAVELDPANTMAVGNLTLALLDGGDIGGVDRSLAPWRDKVDRFPALGLIMMKVALRQGRKDESKKYGNIVTASPNAKPDLLFELGQILVETGDLQNAEVVLRRVASEDPKNFQARLVVAGILRTTDRSKEALSVVEAVLRERPDEPRALQHRGLIQRELGNLEAAVFDLDRATSRDTRLVDTVVASAECLVKLGRPEAALLRLETLLEPNRQVPEHIRGVAGRFKAEIEGALRRDRQAPIRAPK